MAWLSLENTAWLKVGGLYLRSKEHFVPRFVVVVLFYFFFIH